MDAPYRRTQSARQRFVANIERYRKEANPPGVGSHPIYNPKVDGPVLDRLCADDPRLRDFWGLVVELPNDWFNYLVDALLMAAAVTPDDLLMDAKVYKARLGNAKHALELVEALWRVLEDGLPEVLSPRLTGCLLQVKSDLDDEHLRLSRDDALSAVSRKAASVPHHTFMVEAPDILEDFFEAPHPKIVVDLVDVLYGVTISEDAIRKARARAREQEQETKRRAERFKTGLFDA